MTMSESNDAGSRPGRFNRIFGPIVAGLIIDLMDLATFGPMGLMLGLPAGLATGYWMGYCLGLAPAARWWCSLAAGIYCMIPFTEFLPLATLAGAYAQYRESDDRRNGAAGD